jgi:hypothetical protein
MIILALLQLFSGPSWQGKAVLQCFFFFCLHTSKWHMKNANKKQLCPYIMHFGPKSNLKTNKLSNLIYEERTMYLWVEEGAKNCNGSSNSIDGLDWCMEDYDGGDYDRYPLHRVSYAECQGRNLIERHVWNLVIQVVEDTLGRHPPAKIQSHILFS